MRGGKDKKKAAMSQAWASNEAHKRIESMLITNQKEPIATRWISLPIWF